MKYDAKPQVNENHYNFMKYNNKFTWMNFWYQIIHVLKLRPQSVLEIGPGNKIVTDSLRKEGVLVTTLDIDKKLNPDVVGSVSDLPFEDKSFDVVLCSEVLEHLPHDLFRKSLSEIRRVARRNAVLCLPNAGAIFLLFWKVPLFKYNIIFFKLPFFWKKHRFNGEHYWETGKKGFQISAIKKELRLAGFKILKVKIFHDDPAHCFFILE